jgi:FkbM family methyltransferase
MTRRSALSAKDMLVDPAPPPELNLLGHNELLTVDRWELERRSRALAMAVNLGDGVMLCRAMGRYKMFLTAHDVGFTPHLLLDGIWDPWMTPLLARTIKPGMTVVDAGANHGYFTLMLADLVGPDGRVAAIEPHPVTAGLLRRTVGVNGFAGRTTVFEQAVGAHDDMTLTFELREDDPKNARVVGDHRADQPGMTQVKGGRLETLLADWPKIDFIKIDVEGAEEAVLEGAWPLIVRDRPDILLEFNHARCSDPLGLLERLVGVYRRLRTVTHDSEIVPVTRAQLLDKDQPEDWMLWLSRR